MQKFRLIGLALLAAISGGGPAGAQPDRVGPELAGGKVAVTTYHYDNLRTGWNKYETQLSALSFPGAFGIIAVVSLDDQVDAQPLLVPNVTLTAGPFAGTTHDVVYVATASNTVYAIDASNGTILLSKRLGTPVPRSSLPGGCPNNGPNVGISGTPVIDLTSQTLYAIAYVSGSPQTYQIAALDLSSLNFKNLGAGNPNPRTVAASHRLTNGSVYSFDARYQRQRPALLLNGGNVYAAFGSFCDFAANVSRGWLLAGMRAPSSRSRQMNSPTAKQARPPIFS